MSRAAQRARTEWRNLVTDFRPTPWRLLRRSNLIVLTCGALAGAAFAVGPQLAPLAGSVRHPELFPLEGSAVASSDPVHFAVSLKPRDPAGLQHFADEVSNPFSTNYHQYLTPEQVADRFGPTRADVAAVVAFLGSYGFAVSDIAK